MQLQFPDLQVLILAAGEGKRMRSSKPKVLHTLLGKAMVMHVLHAAEELSPRNIIIVTGHGSERVRAHIGAPQNLDWVEQQEQLGTGHAVLECEATIQGGEHVLIVCGDTPLLQASTLANLVEAHTHANASVSFMTATLPDATGYGRVVRDEQGEIKRVVEHRDASEEERLIGEVNTGIFCVRREDLFSLLKQVGNQNDQKEYYLPDIIPLALAEGKAVLGVPMQDAQEMYGINNRQQLAVAEQAMQKKIIEAWQLQGVTIENPESVRIEASVSIGSDTTIRAGSQLLGATHIGDECEIGPYAVIHNAWLDDRIKVLPFTHIEEANLGAGTYAGPFARLRPGAKLDEDVRVGNFVEVKQSVIGRGSKINHLSYVGDTYMGSGCNIGAGTITCNYDGANKHQTMIGDRVFVGSDTKLVAPVSVGDDATIGAGSIVTKPVHAGGLTLSARPEQRHLPDWQRPRKND